MAIPPELLPVVQITLPLLVGMYIASRSRIRRLDDIAARLSRIEDIIGATGELRIPDQRA